MTTRQIILRCCILLLTSSITCAQGESVIPIIFDTDFALPPQDDSLALMLALQSPEIEILGITTVAGNKSVEQANADVLRMLEIANRPDIPVFQGADLPLVHRRSDFAVRRYGSWYSDEPPSEPYGGFASKRLENESAVQFLVRTVLDNPGEVTVVALGPLTNIAQALHQEPAFARSVHRLIIMGGAVAILADGAGNMTPNAEFNFWVDPEAARITLRSGIPIELSPLNVSRKSALTRHWFDKMVENDTPLTRLLKDTMGPQFAAQPNREWTMFDQIAMASLIDPTLVKTERLYVDVNINQGISYGVSVGGRDIWPGAEGAQQMNVQYDLDWLAFIEMFVARLNRPIAENDPLLNQETDQ